MKFVLFVEGHTERKALPQFLKRWLDEKLSQPIRITPVRFDGWADYLDEVQKKARMHLAMPGDPDVIAVIGLLDLYGPTVYPDTVSNAGDRIDWARNNIERKVNHERFRQFFAVHEVEAWLLSQPEVFPSSIRRSLPKAKEPETVDFDKPPSKRLHELYEQHTGRGYKKVTQGASLFRKLDPEVAYEKCPNLKAMLDEMLSLAQQAGL